jgi:hypothetical protein
VVETKHGVPKKGGYKSRDKQEFSDKNNNYDNATDNNEAEVIGRSPRSIGIADSGNKHGGATPLGMKDDDDSNKNIN